MFGGICERVTEELSALASLHDVFVNAFQQPWISNGKYDESG